MKTSNKITAAILAAITLFSFAGCSKEETNGEFLSPSGSNNVVSGTTHEIVVNKTEHKLVDNGSTDYKIFVSEDGKKRYADAINELQYFFEEATNIKLDVVVDNDTVWDSNAKYISLGDNSLLESAKVDVDYDTIGAQGYQIETEGKTIFICGEKRGVLYGVYETLYHLFDYETLSEKVTYIKKGIKDLGLPKFDIVESPDIEYRVPVTGTQRFDLESAHRMRMLIMEEAVMAEGGAHNVLKYIVPYNEWIDSKPNWFSNDKTQLCYTAHGNEEEYAQMIQVAAENIKEIILRYPEQDAIGITQMDVETWCECPTCQGLEDYYGTNAASQIYFINDVTDIVNVWLEEEQGGRDVQFMIFAYHKSERAPARQNADGTWTAIDDTVKLNDNVAIWIAPLYEDYTISVHHPDSINIRTMMESWHACTNTYFVWAYNVYFDNYLIPYDSYEAVQDMIKYFVSHNTKFLWAQGNYNTHQNTGYDDLKSYLFSKLMWNCNADINALIANYFKKVYREAADIMESSFWTWRVQSQKQKALGRSGSIYAAPDEEKFWPKGYLDGQLSLMEDAKKAIEIYKESDPALYKAIYDSIVCETISPRYLLLELYSNRFSKLELAEFKAAFKADTNRLGFDQRSEHVGLSGYAD